MKKNKDEIRNDNRIKKALESHDLIKYRSNKAINIKVASLRKYLLKNFNINCNIIDIVRIVSKYFDDLDIDNSDIPRVINRSIQTETVPVNEECLCRKCLYGFECWGIKNQCEYYKPRPPYKLPNYWPKANGF